MINTQMKNIKCNSCKCYRFNIDFISKDRVMKSCNVCRTRSNKQVQFFKKMLVANNKTGHCVM